MSQIQGGPGTGDAVLRLSGVSKAFGGLQVREALARCTLGAATFSGTYTLNRRLA